jgi:hypothetical protein
MEISFMVCFDKPMNALCARVQMPLLGLFTKPQPHQDSAKARSMTKAPGVLEHRGAAADHHPVGVRVEFGQAQIGKQFAVFHQIGETALVFVGLAGHSGVVQQLFTHHLAQKFVGRQLVSDVVVVSQLVDLAHAVHQDHFFKALVGVGVADDAHERGKAGAGGHEVKVFAGQQIVAQQSACGLAPHHDGVACLDVLQLGGQGAIGHLDAEEFKVLFVIGAGDRIGAQQRFAVVTTQADHGEVAIGKAQRLVACGGEAEQAVGPVVNAQYAFFKKSTHWIWMCVKAGQETQCPWRVLKACYSYGLQDHTTSDSIVV